MAVETEGAAADEPDGPQPWPEDHTAQGPSHEAELEAAMRALPKSTTPLSPGRRGGATARSALGWYRPSVGVPRDVGY